MPRVPDIYLESVCFLYPDADQAVQGLKAGGSGVLVVVPFSERVRPYHLYAVSARHVVRAGNAVIRFHTRAVGPSPTVDLSPTLWTDHPDGDDVSAVYLGLEGTMPVASAVSLHDFIDRDTYTANAFGPGDDVIITGRFAGLDTDDPARPVVANIPTLRTGVVAAGSTHRIENEFGIMQESFLVEMHSLGGYSGSPAFVFVPPIQWGTSRKPGRWFLGIDWGHYPDKLTVREKSGAETSEGWYVEANSGIATVVPAWKVRDLIMSDEFAAERQLREKRYHEEHPAPTVGSVPIQDRIDEPDFTKADFQQALKKVSRRKPSPPDEETSGT